MSTTCIVIDRYTTLEREKLSDGSVVWNVLIALDSDDPYCRRAKIGCKDKRHANQVIRALQKASFIELL
jgi:hypothetical protein